MAEMCCNCFSMRPPDESKRVIFAQFLHQPDRVISSNPQTYQSLRTLAARGYLQDLGGTPRKFKLTKKGEVFLRLAKHSSILIHQFTVGQEVTWTPCHYAQHGLKHQAVVEKIGKRRVTVRVEMAPDFFISRVVEPNNLQPLTVEERF